MKMYRSKTVDAIIINNKHVNVAPQINIESLIVPPEIEYETTSLIFHTIGSTVTWVYPDIESLSDDLEDIKIVLKKYNTGGNFSIH